MSKASEYAEKVKVVKSLHPYLEVTPVGGFNADGKKILGFSVTPDGNLEVGSYLRLDSKEALRLADWIKETFE